METGHYFDSSPAVRSEPRTVTLALPDLTVDLRTDRGVFSADRIDPGTRLLLLEAPPPPGAGDLLDLGCGYGPIACALAHRAPGATVWAVDVNARALELTARNAAHLGLGGVHPVQPDAVPDSVRFAGIWSNPPVRVGKAALHRLLADWLPRLQPDGSAWLVVHRHLGADSLATWLGGEGWAVTRVASKRGYRILRVVGR